MLIHGSFLAVMALRTSKKLSYIGPDTKISAGYATLRIRHSAKKTNRASRWIKARSKKREVRCGFIGFQCCGWLHCLKVFSLSLWLLLGSWVWKISGNLFQSFRKFPEIC